MTSYYKQSSMSGTSWKRCHLIHIHNTFATLPNISFFEEEVLSLPDSSIVKLPNYDSCGKVFDPTSGQINLIDPETGISTGEVVTHMKLYQILHSLYIQTALERDAYAAEQAALAGN